ncbi:MAG: hypothetical protein ABI624_10905 [Casimicrobiaceae bacterium]
MPILFLHSLAHAHPRRRHALTTVATPPAAGKGVTAIFLWVAAAALLFEEWFWARSTRAIARIGEVLHLSVVGDWIRRRPPLQALALFAVPLLVIYPFKVLAVVALANGYVALGSAAFVAAKLVATAVFARLYELTEPAVLQFAWIRFARRKFLAARAYIHAWLNDQPAYRRARTLIRTQAARLACRYRAAYRQQVALPRSARGR